MGEPVAPQTPSDSPPVGPTPSWDRDKQRADALARANLARLAHAALKRELKSGRTTFTRALVDARAETMTIFDLLVAQDQWGRVKALRVLRSAALLEHKRVGTLTEHQMRVLVTRYTRGTWR